jgi:hypothetical protein
VGPTLRAGGDRWDGSASADDLGVEEPSYLRLSVQPADADSQEVVMSPTVTSLDQIDLEISLAFIALGAARTAFERCPSGENAQVVDDARKGLDDLLDARLATRR